MTVREQLSKELEQAPDELVEKILDFCLFLKQRQKSKKFDEAIVPQTNKVSKLDSQSILVSEDEWRGIQETLYLLSIPKMRESILEGLSTSIGECSEQLEW